MHKTQSFPAGLVAGLFMCLLTAPGFAGDLDAGLSAKGTAGTPTTESSSSGCPQNADGTFCWMSSGIGEAWASGYTGSGVSVTVADDFTGEMDVFGDLGHGPQWRQHGQWSAQAAGMVAPGAKIIELDYSQPVPLTLEEGLNVINLSYALEEPVSGYAAILGSKFTSATPTQITNQLLDTARTDTLVNYNPVTYGRGEASLSRALAPVSIR